MVLGEDREVLLMMAVNGSRCSTAESEMKEIIKRDTGAKVEIVKSAGGAIDTRIGSSAPLRL